MLTETQVRAWIDRVLPAESPAMEAVRARTEALGLPHEELFPSQVLMLRTLLLATSARDVLELGTFLGYGAASFVEALDALGGGRVVTVDHDARTSREAQTGFPLDGAITDVEFLIGDAAAVCGDLLEAGRRFDLVLLDVAETLYPALYDSCVALLRPNGILVVDNVMMATVEGWTSGQNVVEGPASECLEALRTLLATAADDERVWPALVPLGSGLLLCAKR